MTARPPRGGRSLARGLAAVTLLLMAAASRVGGAAETTRATPPSGRRVLLVTTDAANEIAPVVVTRLRGELRAARFDMDVTTIAADAPRRGSVEEIAAHEGVTAALGIFVSGDRVEMWASDAAAGRTLMQNLPLAPGVTDRRATIVAVKAVDLLKATLAEIWSAPAEPLPVQVPPPPEPPEAEVAAQPAPPVDTLPQAAPGRLMITAGAGWLQAGTARGWAPTVALTAVLGGGLLAARLTVSALGASSDVTRPNIGAAQLAQEIGIAELVLRSGIWNGLRGVLALGAGAHHLSVSGRGAAGFAGIDSSIWSLATTLGAGIILDVSPHLALTLDARAVENLPATDVHIDGAPAAHIGRPIVWLALAAGVKFR
jgi:hypothetical protein